MNPNVDIYLAEGCGRCPLVATPACKVQSWQAEMKQLRSILLECGLTEEVKWKMPCYTFQENNILMMAAFKEYCALSFFKGVLLQDKEGILTESVYNLRCRRFLKISRCNLQDCNNLLNFIIFDDFRRHTISTLWLYQLSIGSFYDNLNR